MKAAEVIDIENPEALAGYLCDSGRVSGNEPLEIRVLRGGVSNRTVLVRRDDGSAWVLKQALAQLRVQVEWFSDPRRNEREAEGIRWLEQLAPPGSIPRLVFLDREQHLLAMEAVPEPHENWKSVLLGGRVDMQRICQFAELLGTIHHNSSGRADVAETFAHTGYFESLRLEPYYDYTASRVPEAAGFLHPLMAEARTTRQTLVHGDYSPKNILLHGTRMVLVDHEVIHWGDPAFDVGFSLTHLMSKAHHLRDHRGDFVAAARLYWQQYAGRVQGCDWGPQLPGRTVRHTLGCLLARVAGRSPLEYFDAAQRAKQQDVVIRLMARLPATVEGLIDEFVGKL